jgi:hypothetical protein
MAWLPMYLVEKDLEILNEWLNREDEIAFIVSDGSGKWIAKKEYSIVRAPNYYHDEITIWHIPSGPLPLIKPTKDGSVTL